MQRMAKIGFIALVWVAASAGWAADKIYHFTFTVQKNTIECWVSGEKFRMERVHKGVPTTHVYDGARLLQMQKGVAEAIHLPDDVVSQLSMWRTLHNPQIPGMSDITKGEAEKVGALDCRTQTYAVSGPKGQADVKEWLDAVSGLVIKRQVDVNGQTQETMLDGFEAVASVQEGWFAAAAGLKIQKTPQMVKAGVSAEDFSLKRFDNDAVIKLSDYKGKKAVFVNFFATWCGPCKMETPDLVKLYRVYKDHGIEFVSIDAGEGKADPQEVIPAYLKKYNVSWPVVMDEEKSPVMIKYNPRGGIPFNFLVDKEGVVQYVQAGVPRNITVEQLLGKEFNRVLNLKEADVQKIAEALGAHEERPPQSIPKIRNPYNDPD